MKRIVLCLLAGLLIISLVGAVAARRCWDWDTGLLSTDAWVFSRPLPSSIIQGQAPGAPPLGIGQGLANLGKAILDTGKKIGKAIIKGTDTAVEWAEDKVEKYQLGPALTVFIPGSGLDFTTD